MNLLFSFGSFLLAMGPLLLMGLFFKASSKMMAKLKAARNPKEAKGIFLRMKRRIQVKAIARLLFFILLSAILLLYIVCFSQVASDSMLEDWMISCVLVVAMDLVLFELMAGVLFGIFATCSWSCRSTKSMLRFLVAFEFYRVHRNLV